MVLRVSGAPKVRERIGFAGTASRLRFRAALPPKKADEMIRLSRERI